MPQTDATGTEDNPGLRPEGYGAAGPRFRVGDPLLSSLSQRDRTSSLSTTRSLSLSLALMAMLARLMGGPGFMV